MKKFTRCCVIILAIVIMLLGCSPPPKAEITGPFPVVVDYSLSLREMINAGRFTSVNYTILNWKTDGYYSGNTGQKKVALYLVNYDQAMMPDKVLKSLDKMGFRSATIPELLFYGIKYPYERQKEYRSIVVFDPAFENMAWPGGVCYFNEIPHGRYLSIILNGYHTKWGVNYSFLAVRK